MLKTSMETSGKAAGEILGEEFKEKTNKLLYQLEGANSSANYYKQEASDLKRELDEYKEDEIQDTIMISKLFRKQNLTSKEKAAIANRNITAARLAGHSDGDWPK